MSTAKRDRLISSNLVELGKSLPKRKKNSLSNNLAISILDITKNKTIATNLLEIEKQKISFRGTNKKAYLFGEEQNLESVLTFFYINSVWSNEDGYVLRTDLTLSELLLIYGVFLAMYEKYKNVGKKEHEALMTEKKRVRQKPSIDDRKLTEIRERLMTVAQVKMHLSKIGNSLMVDMSDAFGFSVDDMSNVSDKQLNLKKAFHETLRAFPIVKGQLLEFYKEKDLEAINVIELLHFCGDRSPIIGELMYKLESKQKVRR